MPGSTPRPRCTLRARRARVNVVLEAFDGEDFPPFRRADPLRLIAPEARLSFTAPCVRCVIPSIDPATAVLDERFGQALAALSQQHASLMARRFLASMRAGTVLAA